MQAWNPIEYAQKREQIEQSNLKRQALGAFGTGAIGHLGGGKTSKSPTGVTRYDRPTGSMADALGASGFMDKMRAMTDRNVNPSDVLDIDPRYATDGIKPGEAPDWAVGFKPKPPVAPGAAAPGAVPPVAGAMAPKPPMNPLMAQYMANRAKMSGQS